MTSAIERDSAGACAESGNNARLGATDWLSLVAAPTFAIMAALTGLRDSGPMDVLCSQSTSPLAGMVPMYLLMSAFHSAPWLKLISSRRNGAALKWHSAVLVDVMAASRRRSAPPSSEVEQADRTQRRAAPLTGKARI
jgi:hypothetical protein